MIIYSPTIMSIKEPIEHVGYINKEGVCITGDNICVDRVYFIETFKLLTDIRERHIKLLSTIKELINSGEKRYQKELELVSSINNDSLIIGNTKILGCTDRLLLESIKDQVKLLLEKNIKNYLWTWGK